MAAYYLVERACGPDWDHSRRRREQEGWTEHAAFMDRLVEEGVIVLGGPIGESEDGNALQIVDLQSEAEVRTRLAEDPWPETMLTIESIRPWSVWLRRKR